MHAEAIWPYPSQARNSVAATHPWAFQHSEAGGGVAGLVNGLGDRGFREADDGAEHTVDQEPVVAGHEWVQLLKTIPDAGAGEVAERYAILILLTCIGGDACGVTSFPGAEGDGVLEGLLAVWG